jgi:hypothetical protein
MANVCEDRATAFGSFDGYVGDVTKQSFTVRPGWCGSDTAIIYAVDFLVLITVLAARDVRTMTPRPFQPPDRSSCSKAIGSVPSCGVAQKARSGGTSNLSTSVRLHRLRLGR